MKKYFLLGLAIKLIFIFFTFHNDLIFIWERPAHFIQNLHTIGSYYGPLTYITFGILSPIYFISQYVGYWILKIPYLLVDLYIFSLLIKMIPKTLHKKVMIFWWLNPVVIFATYGLGQLDIFLALCVAFSVYIVRKSRTLSVSSLGAGIAYKTMTLPLLIPAILISESKFLPRIKLLILSLLIPFTLGFVFWFLSKTDIINAFFPKGIIFYPKLSTTPDLIWEYFSLIIGLLGFIYLQYKLLINKISIKFLPDALFSALAFVIIALPIYSVHRYMVLIPLLILVAIKFKKTTLLAIIFWSLIFGYVYVWRLQWGLIAHTYSQAGSLPALREWVAPFVNYENIAFLLRIIADSLIFYLAVFSLKKMFLIKK